MHENKLLASVVLFRELYDSNKDIYDVIGELLKAAIAFESKWTFNTTEATELLKTTFGFSIPEAVVKSTLRNRLQKKEQALSFSDGLYSVISNELRESNLISTELGKTRKEQSKIIDALITYIDDHSSSKIDEKEKHVVIDAFSTFLLDNEILTTHSKLISSFIVKNESAPGFRYSLNAIREGFVLYNGTRTSPNLNELGTWNTELTIYLDTELLFHVAGYNGLLFKQLFEDFFNMAKEINSYGKKLISFRYFKEVKEDIDSFFYVASLIIDGKATLDPSKDAMVAITNGCKTKSDISLKKTKFYSKLSSMLIDEGDNKELAEIKEYNIFDSALLKELKVQAEAKKFTFNDEKCLNALRMFSKINALRQDIKSSRFEQVKYILLSGNSSTLSYAFNKLVKTDSSAFSFATSIDYATNELWFKLQKGLITNSEPPKSLDVVANAQIVLSSQISGSVSDKYDEIRTKVKNKELTIKEAEAYYIELRSQTIAPEAITATNIDEVLGFINQRDLEKHLREKSLIKQKLAEGEAAKGKLFEIEQEEKKKKKRRKRYMVWSIKLVLYGLVILSIIFCYYLAISLIISFSGPNDTPLTIIGVILTLVFGTWGVQKKWKVIASKIESMCKYLTDSPPFN